MIRKTESEQFNKAYKTAKRLVLTMLCCVPFMIIIAFLFRESITGWLQYLLFLGILIIAVSIEELIYHKRQKRLQAKEFIEGNKDVFK